MSDPVTNVEIEDVLSSIRRLVSTDDRAGGPEKPGQTAISEKLVLTPALRVDETDESRAHADKRPGDQPLADPEDESDLATDAGTDKIETASTPDRDDAPDPEEAADESGMKAETAATDDIDAESPRPAQEPNRLAADGLSARVAELEAAVAARDDEWEPDGALGDDNAAQPTEALPWQDADDEAAPTAGFDDQDDDFEEDEDEILSGATANVSPTEGLDPFDSDEPDDPAADMSDDADDPDPAQPLSNAFLEDEDPLGDDAAILDEEALRDLVTDIVRQELQGALGERITRNVRKLVRREIHRALATQELE